ncbi:type IV secretory system conjugative DNA transfer family protein, partial (plasmid) [Acuticoccus sp. MNP-M23]|uniref:type IV secretory system conjugative DNA transfer family protein n=1 Tax=Acuticoccus sp. MNP-M23 TaxID=3072793 RepID=UPI0028150A3E
DALVMQQVGAAAHWTQSARTFLRALALYVAKTEPADTCNLIRLRELLLEVIGNQSKSPVLEHMQTYAGTIRHGAAALAGKPAGERGSILSTCDTQTEFLDDPAMARVLRRSDFEPEDLKRGVVSVFLCLPAGRLATHGRWFRLLIGLAMDAMERTGPIERGATPVLFCLDEFAALGHMETVEKAAGQIAGFGVKLWPILQDLGQLQALYGDAWETFMGNAGLLTFWGNTDLTTAKHISDRLGSVPVQTVAASHNVGTTSQTGRTTPEANLQALLTDRPAGGAPSRSSGETKVDHRTTNEAFQLVPMLSPAEVTLHLSRSREIVLAILPDALPILLDRCQYFDDKHADLFGGLYDPPPTGKRV